ncbi:Dimethyltransferase, partial [Globisporangium splendens]
MEDSFTHWSRYVEILLGESRVISVVQDPDSFVLGTTVWDSSKTLLKFIEQHAALFQAFSSICELGAGCGGLAGIACAINNNGLSDVVLTDIGPVLPWLRRNVRNNLTAKESERVRIEQHACCSQHPLHALEKRSDLEHWLCMYTPTVCISLIAADCILCADVVYEKECVRPLVQSILALSHRKTVIYLANERRAPQVRAEFMRHMDAYFHWKEIDRSELDTGYIKDAIEVFEMRPKKRKVPEEMRIVVDETNAASQDPNAHEYHPLLKGKPSGAGETQGEEDPYDRDLWEDLLGMVATTVAKSFIHTNEKLDAALSTVILNKVSAESSIQSLHITHAGLAPSLIVQITDFLERNATLTQVDLSGNAIGVHGATCLAASIAKNENSRLTTLTLSNCGLNNESLTPWIEFFRNERITDSKHFTQLNLSGNQLDENSLTLLTELVQAVAIPGVRFDLRKNKLSDANIRELATALTTNRNIVGLRLEGNQQEGDDDAMLRQHKKIEFYLRENCKELQRKHTVERIQQIRHSALAVESCHFDAVTLSIADAELLKVALSQNRSVTDLRFTSNALPAEGTKRILQGLQTNTSVRKLVIIDNNIGTIGMHALSVLLRCHEQRRTQHEKRKKNTKEMATITKAITPSQSALQSVTISNSIHLTLENGLLKPITRRAATALHYSLAHHAVIKSLCLANCGLTDHDIGVIVSGIAWRAQLEELDVRNNAFGDHCVHVFTRMLHRCSRFCRLDLKHERNGERHRLHSASERVADMNALLQDRNGTLDTLPRNLQAQHDAELHTQRCRFRALVRIEAERVIAQLDGNLQK